VGRLRWAWTAGSVLLVLLACVPARAQISPGELSQAHAALEGSARCLDCHAAGGVSRDKCLTCHRALAERIGAKRGLHAQPGYESCARCHVEHQGRAYQLVFWGTQGQAAFDHRLTGLTLEGAHARVGCRTCHAPGRIAQADRLSAGGANLGRTFLGLQRECRSCHEDAHAGRFGAAACSACHTQGRWKPAPGFDHARTAFPLVGLHQAVACERCHTADPATGRRRLAGVAAAGCRSCHADAHAGRLGSSCATCHTPAGWQAASGTFDHARTAFPLTGEHRRVGCESCHRGRNGVSRLRGIPFQTCASCHADPHAGTLGTVCASCHTTASFRAARASFDHARTGYPLEGRHAAVRCASCHLPGAPKRPPHARCADCHADRHAGQLSRHEGDAACERCHDVSGFAAPRFTAVQHAQTAFPLTGAHRAFACTECHREVPVDALRKAGLATSGAGGRTEQFRFASTACVACHPDPHGGTTARAAKGTDCRACHETAAWSAVRFDHAVTGFPLAGSHARVACVSCHRALRFAPRPAACAGCHEDPHQGQFARNGTTACERCHGPTRFAEPRGFDHDHETRFPLGGAHRQVSCVACHTLQAGVRRYRGVPLTCSGCHAR
jgi:hypothetical protein